MAGYYNTESGKEADDVFFQSSHIWTSSLSSP